jgi:hypothetical protein
MNAETESISAVTVCSLQQSKLQLNKHRPGYSTLKNPIKRFVRRNANKYTYSFNMSRVPNLATGPSI